MRDFANYKSFEIEIWKDVKGYEGKYKISNNGSVLSSLTNKILKPFKTKGGYLAITLCNNGSLKKQYIHRLVAVNFLNNKNKFNEVNHKDENKSNNSVDNLEWCDRKYNENYGTKRERHRMAMIGKMTNSDNPRSVKVICLNDNMIFNCIKEGAEYYNIKHTGAIINCCKHRTKSLGRHPVTNKKLVWMYYDEYLIKRKELIFCGIEEEFERLSKGVK